MHKKALPFRPLYNSMNLLSFRLFLQDSRFKCSSSQFHSCGFLFARIVKSAFMHNARNLKTMNCCNCSQAMDLCTAQAAKLTVVCAVYRAILNAYRAVQCDHCVMWVHNGCSFITVENATYKLYLDLPEM